ncbi:putative papain-like cysteine peptidase superfamily [Helianthus anomalus]
MKELLKGSEDKPNLKAFRVVLIPIPKNSHYYLICFDLKNSAIEVIDNIHETKSFVGLQDNDDYDKKDTVLKVVSLIYMCKIEFLFVYSLLGISLN